MSDEPEIADDETRVMQLLEVCRYRLLIHSALIKPDIKKPHLMFDTPVVVEPPEEATIMEVRAAVDAGDTVLLSFADEKRREFVHVVAGRVGWKSVKLATPPPPTKH